MQIRWMTLFVDRPADGFGEVQEFWRQVTGTTMSPTRGAHDEFATFVPGSGDAHLKIQRVAAGPGGSHLDLHVDDPSGAADEAIAAGATELDAFGDVVVLRSPGGFVFCTVPTRVAGVPSPPAGAPGHRTAISELVVDVPAGAFDDECDFWAAITGWTCLPDADPVYTSFERVDGMPFVFGLQRLDESGGVVTGHLDLQCDDVDTTVADHVALGARVIDVHDGWVVLADPSDHPYCVVDERIEG